MQHFKWDLANSAEFSLGITTLPLFYTSGICYYGLRYFLDKYNTHHYFPWCHKFQALSFLQFGQFSSSLKPYSSIFNSWQQLSQFKIHSVLSFFFFFCFCFLGPHLQHMEVPRLAVKSELQLPAYITATATWDPSHVCDLHRSSCQRWLLNPLS